MRNYRSDPPISSSRQPASGLSNLMGMRDKIEASYPLHNCGRHSTCERAWLSWLGCVVCSARVRACECRCGKRDDLARSSTFHAGTLSSCSCAHLETHAALPANVYGPCERCGVAHGYACSRTGETCKPCFPQQRRPAAQEYCGCRLCQRRVEVEVGPPAPSTHKAACCCISPNPCGGSPVLAQSYPCSRCSHACAAVTWCLGRTASMNCSCVACHHGHVCDCACGCHMIPCSCSLSSSTTPQCHASHAPCGSDWPLCKDAACTLHSMKASEMQVPEKPAAMQEASLTSGRAVAGETMADFPAQENYMCAVSQEEFLQAVLACARVVRTTSSTSTVIGDASESDLGDHLAVAGCIELSKARRGGILLAETSGISTSAHVCVTHADGLNVVLADTEPSSTIVSVTLPADEQGTHRQVQSISQDAEDSDNSTTCHSSLQVTLQSGNS